MLKEVLDPKKTKNSGSSNIELQISNIEYRIGNLIFKIARLRLLLMLKI